MELRERTAQVGANVEKFRTEAERAKGARLRVMIETELWRCIAEGLVAQPSDEVRQLLIKHLLPTDRDDGSSPPDVPETRAARVEGLVAALRRRAGIISGPTPLPPLEQVIIPAATGVEDRVPLDILRAAVLLQRLQHVADE